MKKTLVFIIILSLIGFTSCEKTESEVPGQIPGMGNTPGKLQVKESYSLPSGIIITSAITGLEPTKSGSESLKSAEDIKSDISWFGSGKLVRLKLTLLNSKNSACTVFFPKGLVWECQQGSFQHGLQIQTIWVTIQPNDSRTIIIDLYCVNLGIPAPDHTASFKILGVTNSQVMWSLLSLINWRKVNYEMIYGTIHFGKGSTEVGPTYDEITNRLQGIVHDLTNRGLAISEEDKAFILGIPELSPEDIPLVDQNSKFPEYFEEFIVPGK
jgi:hypothetical protein